MSEQNKIPTNSELLWKWAKKIGWEEGCDVTCEELWELIKAARAAGREEQREKIKIYERALNKIASWSDGDEVGGHFDEPGSAQIARDALAEAIRAQGEGEK